MKTETLRKAVLTLICGNISDFKVILKRCSKRDLIDLVFIYHYETGADLNKSLNKMEDLMKVE